MQSKATSPQEYIDSLPDERKPAVCALRDIVLKNLPDGFQEQMSYGMLGYVVPHSIYPAGYHCDPSLPLPFLNIASLKNYIAVYHMGLYADEKIYDWFIREYAKISKTKPDIGKSCIRFKKTGQIPYELIGELASKMSVEDCISYYEQRFKK